MGWILEPLGEHEAHGRSRAVNRIRERQASAAHGSSARRRSHAAPENKGCGRRAGVVTGGFVPPTRALQDNALLKETNLERPTAAGIAYMVFDVVLTLILCAMCWYFNPEPENAEGGRGQVAAQAAVAAAPAVVQTRTAPVVKQVKLRYFPYSTLGRRASERLVCAICLDEFLHGDACGEVPACRHFFHRRCVDAWKKSSHTCPLCRQYMATGPARVSAADDMV